MHHSCYLRASLGISKSLILNVGAGQLTKFFGGNLGVTLGAICTGLGRWGANPAAAAAAAAPRNSRPNAKDI